MYVSPACIGVKKLLYVHFFAVLVHYMKILKLSYHCEVNPNYCCCHYMHKDTPSFSALECMHLTYSAHLETSVAPLRFHERTRRSKQCWNDMRDQAHSINKQLIYTHTSINYVQLPLNIDVEITLCFFTVQQYRVFFVHCVLCLLRTSHSDTPLCK